MSGLSTVRFGAQMLFNTVTLKPGMTFEDVEIAVGELCTAVFRCLPMTSSPMNTTVVAPDVLCQHHSRLLFELPEPTDPTIIGNVEDPVQH